jgi:alkanesulfonate monooxygenase SsuD/methylene tetrahydromethanopterin reductase-like flavin-dependent oxidoreductase (luciferase family)
MSGNGHLRVDLFVLSGRSTTQADIVEQACLAEELGFDGVLLAERHLRHGRLFHPSPFVLVAAIAARTTTLRVGTAGRILSLDHPIHVAEDAATLDVLSGGRLELGLTRASLDTEAHEAFDSPIDGAEERFTEAFEILVRALSEERFSYGGTHFTIPELSVFPRPVQRPHPPISIVAVSRERLLFAADRGYRPILGALARVDELEDAFAAFFDRAAAAGHNGGLDPSVNRFVYVSETDESARREMAKPFVEFIADYAPDLKAALVARYGEGPVDYDRVVEDFCLFGSPSTVTERLLELRERVGLRRLMATVNFPTVEHDLCVASMRRFATEVLPAVRDVQLAEVSG